MAKNKPSFKKVIAEETKSMFTPMNSAEVEDEVLEAVKEARISPEVEIGEIKVKVTPRPVKVKEKVRPKPHKHDHELIRGLRKQDRKGLNKTCSRCARRMPLAQMDGGKADLCDDCR